MLLGLRTDSPLAELYLYDNQGQRVAGEQWQADRELAHRLLARLETFLTTNDTNLNDLRGLFVFEGPGSFTGLRIGMTVMNTLAYSLEIPIVATAGDGWLDRALERLLLEEDDKVTLPLYGADARVTAPKK